MTKWYSKLFQRGNVLENPAVPLSQAYKILADLPSSAGVPVTLQSILGNPAVRKAVDLIAGKVSCIPLPVYRKGTDDTRQKDSQHAGAKLIQRPAPYYTGYTWRHAMMVNALVYRNAYSYIDRQGTSLLLLDPQQTSLVQDRGYLEYKTIINSSDWRIPLADVLHIRGLGDGLTGFSLLDTARDALGLGLALQKYGANYFKNNATPRIVVIPPETVKGAEKIRQFKDEWVAMFAGIEAAGRPGFAPPGTQVIPIETNNDNAQFLQSREFDLVAVANLFGLPPHKLGAKINTSYASLESEERAFLSDTLDPWLHTWEEECDSKLLTEQEKEDESCYFEFERKALLQIDAKTEHELLKSAWEADMISWEEMRSKQNLPTNRDDSQTWYSDLNKAPENPFQQGAISSAAPSPHSETGAKDASGDTQKKLNAMTRSTLARLVKRLERAAEGGKVDLAAHRAVFLDGLAAHPQAEIFTDRLFERVQRELDAVLPEQRAAVIQRLDIDTLTEDLCQA